MKPRVSALGALALTFSLVLQLYPSVHWTAAARAEVPVLVWFKPGVVGLPQGLTITPIGGAHVSSDGLAQALREFGVDSIALSIPDFATSGTGENVGQTDWSNILMLKPRPGTNVASLLARLKQMPEIVLHAEPVPVPVFCGAPVYPNDPRFRDGSQWGSWNYGQSANGQPAGTSDADTDAPEAWGRRSTGELTIRIAIIDTGFTGLTVSDSLHPEFSGRMWSLTDLTWDSVDHPGHGFRVAGVAAATGANGRGIAGMDWKAALISEDITGFDKDPGHIVPAAIRSAYLTRGAKVLNHSYVLKNPLTGNACDTCWAVGLALADAYRANTVNVAAMGNISTAPPGPRQYPASYAQGVISVGATDATDARWSDSVTGSAIDVSAPGANIISTDPCGNPDCTVTGEYYSAMSGTSLAAPVATGLAGLLLAKYPGLYNDDVENIIRLSADNVGTAGWDSTTGFGRVNAQRAVRLLDAPNRFAPGEEPINVSNPPVDHVDPTIQYRGWLLPPFPYFTVNLNNSGYRLHRVSRRIDFPTGMFHSTPHVWGRGAGANRYKRGWSKEDLPNYGMGYCEVDSSQPVNSTGCTLQTYIFEFYYQGYFLYWPCRPESVAYAWAALEMTEPGPSQSFFVPQAIVSGSVVEGNAATGRFRTCPNADGATVLSNNARVKVVVKDAVGNGIAGISPADIFVLLNGGTQAQDFVGDGADSVIANSTWNPAAQCPDLRMIPADSATDASGTTYITFLGAGGQRDSARKWGHYDAEMPVYVLGTKLSGR